MTPLTSERSPYLQQRWRAPLLPPLNPIRKLQQEVTLETTRLKVIPLKAPRTVGPLGPGRARELPVVIRPVKLDPTILGRALVAIRAGLRSCPTQARTVVKVTFETKIKLVTDVVSPC